MRMMRIASLTYNGAKDCMGSGYRDEQLISTYILSFEIAEHLMRSFEGQWKIINNEIILNLKDLSHPLTIDFNSGVINYGTLMTRFYHRYRPEKGVRALVREICSDLAIPIGEQKYNPDFMFKVLVKLVEIFHARCDLRIIPSKREGEWEMRLGDLSGWISADKVAENRFGQKVDLTQWENLRIEKIATYIFGFNRFCKNFDCPMK